MLATPAGSAGGTVKLGSECWERGPVSGGDARKLSLDLGQREQAKSYQEGEGQGKL